MITQLVGTVVFSGAAGLAGSTIWSSVAPQWQRIARLAVGIPEVSYAPLSQLVQAERRIAVRRWSSPVRLPLAWREVA